MPQFDTFTFLSQITWVFFLFGIVYLSISYTFSPITATILKVRKLKFLDIKKSSLVLTENLSKNSFDTNLIQQNFLLGGIDFTNLILSHFYSNFSIEKKYNSIGNICNNFFNKNFLFENLFFKNKFRNILLRSIYNL